MGLTCLRRCLGCSAGAGVLCCGGPSPLERCPPGRGFLVGFSQRRWNGGERGLPGRGPISWEEMGERTPGGGGSSPGTPFSGGVVWGEAVLLTGYPACGPHIGRPVTARPPAGRAGDVGGYPLGEGREEPFGFPLSPPVNKPLFPPARAGGRAMRRWSLRPQARYADRKPTPLLQQSREKGCGGKKLFPPRGPGVEQSGGLFGQILCEAP